MDLTAAFVVYGCSFCHGYIGNVYGPAGYLMALLAVGFLQRIVLLGSANPLPHVIRLVECPNAYEVRRPLRVVLIPELDAGRLLWTRPDSHFGADE